MSEETNRIPKLHRDRRKSNFYKQYGHLNDSEVLKELLYAEKEHREILSRIRATNHIMVWCLIVIPVLFVVSVLLMGILE